MFESGVATLRDVADETDDADDVDRVYDVLSNRRRRQVLRLLDEQPDTVADVPELASTIAAWESDIDDPKQVTYDDRKSVQAAIYQHHAPKMDEAGLVDYDKRAGRIHLDCDVPSLFRSGDDESDDRSDRRWYALLATAVVAGVAAVHAAVPALANWTLAAALVVGVGAVLPAPDGFELPDDD